MEDRPRRTMLTLSIDSGTHGRLKRFANDHDRTMSSVVEEGLTFVLPTPAESKPRSTTAAATN